MGGFILRAMAFEEYLSLFSVASDSIPETG